MTFILTNDDGIDAPGIAALRRALEQATGDSGIIVAPNAHLSGCSHQFNTKSPITIEARTERDYAIGGTPADCTRVGLGPICPEARFVLSGINAGGNLGSDIHVSGTVAAVREAAILRKPGIAMSHYIHRGREIDWDAATRLAAKVLIALLDRPLPTGAFWNVNLPHPGPDDPDPDLIFCDSCTQPLPTAFQVQDNQFRYVGKYGERDRDPGADVDVCFSGNVAITQIRLW
jgi:5'-nucleotidase